jgi:predicted nuclease of predicted toxin-antitoxin system
MNLVADESVDAQIVERLRTDGHAVPYVAEMSPSITDDEVLDRANADRSPLVTGDKDFGELVFRLHRVTHGVILIRLPGLSAPFKAAIVSEAIRVHGDDMRHAFTVISPGVVRIRRDL